MSSWARRKERIASDPEFRRRVYQQQTESRRRRRAAERGGSGNPCPHYYRDGRRCWRTDEHQHGG